MTDANSILMLRERGGRTTGAVKSDAEARRDAAAGRAVQTIIRGKGNIRPEGAGEAAEPKPSLTFDWLDKIRLTPSNAMTADDEQGVTMVEEAQARQSEAG